MTAYTTRTIPTTTYTTRPSITWFISYTWDNAPDTWAGVTANWDNYWTISTWTSYTTRVIPA